MSEVLLRSSGRGACDAPRSGAPPVRLWISSIADREAWRTGKPVSRPTTSRWAPIIKEPLKARIGVLLLRDGSTSLASLRWPPGPGIGLARCHSIGRRLFGPEVVSAE